MNIMNDTDKKVMDCSTAGKGFARTENNGIVAEDCALPQGQGKGYAKSDPFINASGYQEVKCSTAGKGFAQSENSNLAPEDCPLPQGQGKGYAKTEKSS